jgi:hypothetical protein
MTQLARNIRGLGKGGPSSPWCRRTKRFKGKVRRLAAVILATQSRPLLTIYHPPLSGFGGTLITNHGSLITAFLIDTLPIRIITNYFDCTVRARSNRHSSATSRLTFSSFSSAAFCHFRAPASATAIQVECDRELEQTSRGARDARGRRGAAAGSFENYRSEL